MVFLGYGQLEGSKAWVFFDPVKRKKVVSIHADFWEHVSWGDADTPGSTISFEDDEDTDAPPSAEEEHPAEPVSASREGGVVAVRRSTRIRQAPTYLGNFQHAAAIAQGALLEEMANVLSMKIHQPRLEAIIDFACMASGEQDHRDVRFLPAKRKELKSMADNDVWDLVPLPPGARAIACRWLCTDKLLADLTTMEKARLIVLGHLQTAGRDYKEIFAPVIKMESVGILLALITRYDMEFVQGDVKNAFLYGPLEEVVYMRQPPGFEEKGKKGWVCRLKKAGYGLHQAPRAFYTHITKILHNSGFRPIHGIPPTLSGCRMGKYPL